MQVKEAFQKLRAGAEHYSQTTAPERIQRLDALWQGIMEHKARLVEAGYKELRVDEEGVLAQMMMVKGEIDFAKKHLASWMKPKKLKNSAATMGKKCFIRHQPKGVVLNLSTWNAPICISFVPAVAALAAGNTVLLKPSELAPYTAEILEELVGRTMDPAEMSAVNGGVDIATELLQQPFNHIYYTGGQRVGAIVMKAAADHFAGVTLEMGGKNPIIVDETADLKDAAQKSIWGRMANGGQGCVDPDYVVIHESVAEEYIKHLAGFIDSMYNSDGKGLKNSPYVTRMINERETQRVKGYIEDALSKGATLRFGGDSDVTDNYICPTVLTGITEEMDIMHHEVFGPVISIIPYGTREEAVEIVNRRAGSLSLYVYSQNRDNIEYFLSRTKSGNGCVNHNIIQAGTNPHMAFGGVNGSGIGRIGGYRGFVEMSNERSILEQPMGLRNFNVMFPPYSKLYKRMIHAGIK